MVEAMDDTLSTWVVSMNGMERIVAALQRQPVDRTPVWFMRQADVHPRIPKLAAEHSFWERCKDLDLCTTITMQPLERYGSLDAAIVFNDILTPLPAFGYEVEYGGGIRIDSRSMRSTTGLPFQHASTHRGPPTPSEPSARNVPTSPVSASQDAPGRPACI